MERGLVELVQAVLAKWSRYLSATPVRHCLAKFLRQFSAGCVGQVGKLVHRVLSKSAELVELAAEAAAEWLLSAPGKQQF